MSNEELAVRIREGHPEHITTLWENMYRLFYMLCLSYYRKQQGRCEACGLAFDDLLQECYFAMLGCVEAYDPNRGYKLNTYANRQIQSVLNQAVGIRTEKQYQEPLSNSYSVDKESGEGFTLLHSIPDETSRQDFEDVEDSVYNEQLHEALDRAMDLCLNDEQKAVIRMLYYEGATQQQAAEVIGKSRSRVRQIEMKAIKLLRRPQARRVLKPFLGVEDWESLSYRNTAYAAERLFFSAITD